jgi:RNA polymerase sigma-B factor
MRLLVQGDNQRWERLLARYKDGDHAAREQLVGEMMPLVNSLARRYARGGNHDDLVQAGLMGLTKALDRFDPTTGATLSAYAVPTMLGEMRRWLRDHSWAVHMPRGLQELTLSVSKAATSIEERQGRAATPQQIASELGIDLESVVEALTAGRAYDATSLQQRLGHDSEDLELGDTLGDSEDGYGRAEVLLTLRQARHVLSDRDRMVLHLRFVEDMTQSEIGKRIGVSQMQVSRILRAAIARLRAELRDEADVLAA